MTRKLRPTTAFVPRIVFATVFAGVVPACVMACGGGDSGPATGLSQGVAADVFGVADIAFDTRPDTNHGEFSVADTSFTVADTAFGVADTAFDAKDTGKDAGDTGVDAKDVFSVADLGFSGRSVSRARSLPARVDAGIRLAGIQRRGAA